MSFSKLRPFVRMEGGQETQRGGPPPRCRTPDRQLCGGQSLQRHRAFKGHRHRCPSEPFQKDIIEKTEGAGQWKPCREWYFSI